MRHHMNPDIRKNKHFSLNVFCFIQIPKKKLKCLQKKIILNSAKIITSIQNDRFFKSR